MAPGKSYAPPPEGPPGNRLFGRVIVTIALVGGLVGGLVALMAGKRQAMDRKSRMMAPASELNAGSAGTSKSSAPPAPGAGSSPSAPPSDSAGSAPPPDRRP
jgi:hypothetical protein